MENRTCEKCVWAGKCSGDATDCPDYWDSELEQKEYIQEVTDSVDYYYENVSKNS